LLLMMFGANPAAVQRILRHADIRVTMDAERDPAKRCAGPS
jgi:hypothetical protein